MQHTVLKGIRQTLEDMPEEYRGIVARHFAIEYAIGCVAVSRITFMLGSLRPYSQMVNLDEARALFSEYGIDIDATIRKEGEEMKI